MWGTDEKGSHYQSRGIPGKKVVSWRGRSTVIEREVRRGLDGHMSILRTQADDCNVSD